MKRRLMSHWDQRFFGLRTEDRYLITRERAFNLVYYCGFLYSETMNLPLRDIDWWLSRIQKELNKNQNQNSAEEREMQGMNRTESPARQRRFT